MRDLTDLVTDYTTSEHFLFLDAKLKEHAESLLHFWVERAGEAPAFETCSKALDQAGRLDLPLDIRVAVPHLLKEFFGYISSTGRAPQASQWSGFISQLEKAYVARFREDGSMRGETFKKNYTDVGRNDPCPCGSGKKFKKCCMSLLS